MPPPADRCQPRPWRHYRCALRRGRGRDTPSGEPGRRRSWIETADAGQVLLPVLEDVDERVPHLARSRERSHVISVRPYSPVAAERTINRLCHANGEALNAASQSNVSVRFEKEVDVIALNAEMDDAEPVRRSSRERGSDGACRRDRRRTMRTYSGSIQIECMHGFSSTTRPTWSSSQPTGLRARTLNWRPTES
jgi:hypothetical protein